MIRQETGDEQQQALIELTKEGAELDLKLISRHDEHCFVPVHLIDDKLQEMTQEDLNALNNQDRAELATNMRYMDKKLERLGLHLGDSEDDGRYSVQTLNRAVANRIVAFGVEMTSST